MFLENMRTFLKNMNMFSEKDEHVFEGAEDSIKTHTACFIQLSSNSR